MKKSFFLLFFAFSMPSVFIYSQADMNSGLWRTSDVNRFTRITATDNLETKIYQIGSTYFDDNDLIQFNVIVDGIKLPNSFSEGSEVIVQGKNIAIQQITPGKLVKGSWKIIQKEEAPAASLIWKYVPIEGGEMLIASLKWEQEFLLTILPISNCTSTAMIVLIDNQPISDGNNNTISFLAGSTIYAKGKSIAIRAIGACPGNVYPWGELRIANR